MLHKDTPDPDHLSNILIFLFWMLGCTLVGLAIGVAVNFVNPVTAGPVLWLKSTIGIATEAFFQYSGLSFLLNLLPHVDFANAWLGLKPWADLSGVGSLIPYVSVGAFIGTAIGGRAAWKYHQNMTNPIKHLSGPRILEGKAGAKALQEQIAENFDVDGIFIHPNVQISMRLEIQHFLMIGSTGSGKTTEIQYILDQIINRKDKILGYDVKSDFTQKLQNRIILAPWDRRSWSWFIGMDITTEALAQAFAECFIIPNPKASDPVWDNAARALLRAEIHKLQAHKPGKWTFSDLGKGLLDDLLVGVDDPQENMRNLQTFVRTYFPEAWQIVRDATSKATSSVLFTQGGQLSPLIDICRLDAEICKVGAKKFWLDQDKKGFLSDEVKTCPPVILKRAGDSEIWSRTFISAFINVAALKINGLGDADPDKRRIWFILDEVPQLGRNPQITTFLETSRSKGVRMLLGLQNAEQIEKNQGKEDRMTWENNTLTKIWGQDVGQSAKKWASESVGTHTVQIYHRQRTTGTLPPSSGTSDGWSPPQEKRLLEEHGFEMLLRPKPKKKIVTALLQISGFDRVILDWPMLPRPIHDPKEKDPVVLPPRVVVDDSGQVIASNLAFVTDSLSGSPAKEGPDSSGASAPLPVPPSPPSGGGPDARKEDAERKQEGVSTNATPRLEHVEIPQQQQPKQQKTDPENEKEDEKEAEKIGEKMLTASLSGEDFTGDIAIDSLKLLAAMLDSTGASGTVGRVQIAKPSPAPEPEREDEEERE
jgi:hypothetical protein